MKTKKRLFGPDYGKKCKFTITTEVFRRKVLFRLNVPKDKMLQELEDLGGTTDLEGLAGAHIATPLPNGETVSFIWIPRFFNNLDSLETLAHETLHAAVDILSNCDIPFDRAKDSHTGEQIGSEEVLTHLFGWLFYRAMQESRLLE